MNRHMHGRCSAARWLLATVAMLAAPLVLAQDAGADWRQKLGQSLERRLDMTLRGHSGSGEVDVFILLRGPAVDSKLGLGLARHGLERRQLLVSRLRQDAGAAQAPLRQWLAMHGISSRSFWVVNALSARVPVELLPQLAQRSDVAGIAADAVRRIDEPLPAPKSTQQAAAIEWGVTKVRAPEVWALGYLGQGVVVAGQDTGYQWDHPALQDKYRGWNGASADHNYSWHDAIHAVDWPGGSNGCGFDIDVPCDDHGHGTHTMGTMVGDDGGANQVGVAPEARWIGCRNMEEGDGRPSTYTECFQWFLAPTDSNDTNANPALAPDVINNSWGCPPSEGCDAIEIAAMATVVENVRAAGIVVVASAGNSGSACSTVLDPPAIYVDSLSVGATNSTDLIASFSSRGPTVSGLLKPNVSAPGVSVRSSTPGGSYGSSSGTSMAGPHVAGAVALIISANPTLRGDPDTIQSILETTAVSLTSAQSCGAFPGDAVPNAVFGHGRIDAYAAVLAARALLPDEVFVDGFE